MKTSKLSFKMKPYKIKIEIEFNENQDYSINIIRTDEIAQYIENLSELLPVTYPNVHLRSNDKFYKLGGDENTEVLAVFEALLNAFYH